MNKTKFLYQPVAPWRLSQGFGENKACIDLATGKVTSKVPYLDSTVCPPGTKSVYSQMLGHNGLDIATFRWQRVYAAHDGIVAEIETEVDRGLGIGIVSKEKRFFAETGTEEHYKTRYWHFIALDVYFGEEVKTGDFIGYADSTGLSAGDHLHFELKPVRIKDYENGVPVVSNINQGNGFFGAIDPAPYMESIFALEIGGIVKKIREFIAILNDFVADKARRR